MRTPRLADAVFTRAQTGATRACSSRRLHVVELTPTLAGGGAEERIARICRSLDPSSFRVTWLGFGAIEHRLAERAGARVALWPLEREPARGVEWRVVLRIARLLDHLRPDVLHVHNWSTSLYGIGAARLLGLPVIYGEGGRDDPAPPSPRRLATMRALAPHVERFTAVCYSLGRELQRFWGVTSERVRVIPSGVDLLTEESKLPRLEARAALGLPAHGVCVGIVAGRFRAVKRLPEAIDAVGALAANGIDVHLVVLGELTEAAEALRTRANEAGLGARIHLVGHVPRAARYFSALDVVLSTSRFEGASNALLEAMAAGVPVVATAVGGTPELIAHGKTGLLVAPDDHQALVRSLGDLLEDETLRAKLGDAARDFVAQQHDTARMTESYAELYREVAAGPPRAPPVLEALGESALGLLWTGLGARSPVID